MGEPVGPASDLYSLGVVLYEMLTGELPYDADTPLGIAMKHVNGRLRQPRELDPSIPDGINAITCRLLAKEPLDRYASGDELIEDLERVVAGLEPTGATTEMMTKAMPIAPTRVAPPPPRRADKNRRRLVPLLVALLALLILAPLAWAGYSYLQDQREPDLPQIAVPDLTDMTLEEAKNQHGDDFKIEVADEVDGEQPVNTILSQDPQGGKAEKNSTISVSVVGTRVAQVPDVTGEGREAAQNALEEAGFEVKVEEKESSFDDQGKVMDQDPTGDTEADYGSEVTMTVGTGPSSVTVPDLSGSNLDQAATLLEEAGLKLGARGEDYSDAAEGTVISQDPEADSEAEPGSAVGVTVSLGPEPVVVPNVIGFGVDDAAAEVANAGLTYQTFEYESDEPEGTVVSTDPGAGAELDPGTLVAIYYSTGPPPEPTTADPDEGDNNDKKDDKGGSNNKDDKKGGKGNGGGGKN